MSKYCKPMGLYVTYLDCMECEGKECRKNKGVNMVEYSQVQNVSYVQNMENVKIQKGEQKQMKKIYLQTEINQDVFLVFSSKRENAKRNIIFHANVVKVTIDKNGIIYTCKVDKCVNDKTVDINKYIGYYYYTNANIDTGYRGISYPVFTTKEKCLEWLKQ